MFIYFGVRESKRKMGFVADYCPMCLEITRCRVISIGSVPHLYLIQVGKRTVNGAEVHCCKCNSFLNRDLSGYTSIRRERNASLNDLIETTNPQVEERLLQQLEAEEQAMTGDISPEERFRLLAQPFIDIENEVRRKSQTLLMDFPAASMLLGAFAGLFFLCRPYFLSNPPNAYWTVSSYGGWGCGIMLACFFAYLALRSKNYFQKRFGDHLVAALAELKPTEEEISIVLSKLKGQGSMAARAADSRWFYERMREEATGE